MKIWLKIMALFLITCLALPFIVIGFVSGVFTRGLVCGFAGVESALDVLTNHSTAWKVDADVRPR